MGLWNTDTDDENDPLAGVITPQSDLSRPDRSFHIVTTASLPWFTGTAVNPLLRAAHLYQRMQELQQQQQPREATTAVTLVVPWLEERDDQKRLYGRIFRDCREQEDCIREFLNKNANMEAASRGLQIRWYPARYHAGLGSIFAMGDILECCKSDTLDVCILEEPEHWYVIACCLVL
jgi:digalactosyldiacylglycerol synthase